MNLRPVVEVVALLAIVGGFFAAAFVVGWNIV